MAPIHHRHQLHPMGTAPALQGFKGSPHGAPGEDHVIHQHHMAPIQADGELGGLHEPCADALQIIAVEGGVQTAVGHGMADHQRQSIRQDLGQGHTTGRNSQQHESCGIDNTLENLRSQTIQGAAEFNAGENLDAIPWLSLRNSRRRHREQSLGSTDN